MMQCFSDIVDFYLFYDGPVYMRIWAPFDKKSM